MNHCLTIWNNSKKSGFKRTMTKVLVAAVERSFSPIGLGQEEKTVSLFLLPVPIDSHANGICSLFIWYGHFSYYYAEYGPSPFIALALLSYILASLYRQSIKEAHAE